MLIVGKAVLAFGIFSVFGAAVHNHNRVGPEVADISTAAAQAPAPAIEEAGLIIVAPTAAGLPRGYWSNPATSPLQGSGLPVTQSRGPIAQLTIAWHVETRSEVVSDGIQFATRLQSDGSN